MMIHEDLNPAVEAETATATEAESSTLKKDLEETISDSLHAAKEMIMDEFRSAQSKSEGLEDGAGQTWIHKAEDFIRENPVKSVGIALVAGVLLGKALK